MDRAFAYFPGCALEGSAREYDVSTRLVAKALGLELREIPGWTCCGASSAHSQSHLVGIVVAARALAQATDMGLPLMSPCAMCFERFRHAEAALRSPQVRQQVEAVLGTKMEKTVPVYHLVQVLEKFTPEMEHQALEGLKVASYYGCLLVRPPEITGIDDPENPTIMDRLVARLGAEPVDWAFKTECCGAGMALALPHMVRQLSGRLVEEAKRAEADAIVAACPMCQTNLDLYGGGLPVLYITQLIGLAMGFAPEELMLGRHFVNPLPLLQEKGVLGYGKDRGLSVSLRS